MLTNEEKKLCIKIIKESIGKKLNIIKDIIPCPENEIFKQSFGLFVTLTKQGKLRGCIGYIKPYKELYQALIDLAKAAAFQDNRFRPVTNEEYEFLNIEISILSSLIEIKSKEEIQIGRDGLYIVHQMGSGLLLPQVATQYNMSNEEFLIQTCHKAGLHPSMLSDKNIKIYRFEADIFSE